VCGGPFHFDFTGWSEGGRKNIRTRSERSKKRYFFSGWVEKKGKRGGWGSGSRKQKINRKEVSRGGKGGYTW